MKNIVVGLIFVMVSNILLGTSLAKLKQEFSKKKLINGLVKAGLIILSISLMYGCSYLNPNIMIATINGQEVNLISGMKLIFTAGIIYYGLQSLIKLKDLLKLNINIDNKDNKEGE